MNDTRKDPTLDPEAKNDRAAAVPAEATKHERTDYQKMVDRAHAPSVPQAGHAIAEQSQEEHDRLKTIAAENNKEMVNATGQKIHRKHKAEDAPASDDEEPYVDEDDDDDDDEENDKS